MKNKFSWRYPSRLIFNYTTTNCFWQRKRFTVSISPSTSEEEKEEATQPSSAEPEVLIIFAALCSTTSLWARILYTSPPPSYLPLHLPFFWQHFHPSAWSRRETCWIKPSCSPLDKILPPAGTTSRSKRACVCAWWQVSRFKINMHPGSF